MKNRRGGEAPIKVTRNNGDEGKEDRIDDGRVGKKKEVT
jgi:hypothetical protein